MYMYPAHLPSDVGWLGHVPEHWEVRRIKSLFRECDERSGEQNGELLSLTRSKGLVPHAQASTKMASVDDLSNYKVCQPGDLVMNRMQAWSGMFAMASYRGLVSPDYCVFRKVGSSNVKFFEYLFKTPLLVAQFSRLSKGIGSGFNRLYTDDFGSIAVAVPNVLEQDAIVRYLEYVDLRVRRYVRAKERLIELLEEERQAIVNRAVTRGLDPSVRLKSSGVEWLGDVPEHWEVRRLKTICTMKSGDAITAESIESRGEYPVYGGNGVRGYAASFTHQGDFALIGRQGALCGNVHIARGRFWASEHAVVAALGPGHFIDWFGLALQVMNLNQYSISAAQPGLAVERIMNLPLPVPPALEQQRIAISVGEGVAKIDADIARARRQVELVQEYRTRLIADVVTGKLDVRKAAAGLGDGEEGVSGEK